MPRILLIVSIALMATSAVLGFLTKGKLATIEEARKQAQESFDKANSDKTQAIADRKAAEDAATAARKSQEEANARVAGLESAKRDLETKLLAANSKVSELESKLAQASNQPSEGAGASSEVDSLKVQLAEAIAKQAEAESKAKEAEVVLAAMAEDVRKAKEEAKVFKEDAERRERQFVAKGLEGQILAVNQGWNFVVLSLGDRQGLLPNAQMVVMRGGEMVAKVKVTSVERSTAIADILPGSTPRGMRVMPGDRVIYPGS